MSDHADDYDAAYDPGWERSGDPYERVGVNDGRPADAVDRMACAFALCAAAMKLLKPDTALAGTALNDTAAAVFDLVAEAWSTLAPGVSCAECWFEERDLVVMEDHCIDEIVRFHDRSYQRPTSSYHRPEGWPVWA